MSVCICVCVSVSVTEKFLTEGHFLVNEHQIIPLPGRLSCFLDRKRFGHFAQLQSLKGPGHSEAFKYILKHTNLKETLNLDIAHKTNYPETTNS